MKVIVCGSSHFKDAGFIRRKLDHLHNELRFTMLLQGGTSAGVERFARDWAVTHPEIRRFVCRARWDQHGAAAVARRNANMLRWKPDLVIAFAGGVWAADLVKQAMAAGVPLRHVPTSEAPP
jgi:hypothetical protein